MGGGLAPPKRTNTSSISCCFFFGKVGAPLEGWRPLLRRILDPPLINILPFHRQELVAGIVVVNSKQEVQHQGIYLAMEGAVSLQLSAKSVGLFEAFYNSLKVCPNSSEFEYNKHRAVMSRFSFFATKSLKAILSITTSAPYYQQFLLPHVRECTTSLGVTGYYGNSREQPPLF